MLTDLTKLPAGETAIIKEIKGGDANIKKLQSIGIQVGKKIKKVNGHSSRGPQILKIGNLQIAVGFGMAKHIFVE